MKKRIFIILILLVAISTLYIVINKEKPIEKTSAIEIEATSLLTTHDLIDFKVTEILSENKKINTDILGEIKTSVLYRSVDNELINLTVTITTKDTTAPLIMASSNYYVTQNNDFNGLDTIVCGDNLDSTMNCEIVGTYDTTKLGSYPLMYKATDASGNTTEKNFTLHVNKPVTTTTPTTPTTPNYIYLDDFIAEHKTENTAIGIDVSKWQADIDFNKVKEAGVEFVIMRMGWGHGYDGNMVMDETYVENMKNAKEAGLKVGVYFFSYATKAESAIEQAEWVVEILDGIELDYPIVYDWEIWSGFDKYDISFNDLNNQARAFFNVVEEAGYEGMIYGSKTYLNAIWDLPEYKTWLAHYTSNTDYEGEYYIWQATDSGKVDGISTTVDLNVLYYDNE